MIDTTDHRARGASGLLLFAAILLAASGCDATAWDAHAFTAQTLRDASNGADDTIRATHRARLREVGLEARTSGGDDAAVELAVRTESARWRSHEPIQQCISTQNVVAHLTNAYARAVVLALRGQGVDTEQLLRIAADAVRGLLSLGVIMARAGFDWVSYIPDWVLDLLGVEPVTPEEAEAVAQELVEQYGDVAADAAATVLGGAS